MTLKGPPFDGYEARRRIAELTKRPEFIEFRLLYDNERAVWLGERDTRLGIGEDERTRMMHVAAEGATPAEVLRKLAEMLE